MSSFAHIFSFYFLLSISTICLAAGMPSIIGATNDGYTIAADFEYPPYSIEIWRESKNRKLRSASAQRFDNEPCQFKENIDKKGHETRIFSCAKEAKSPLAGTKYHGRKTSETCEQGAPEFVYSCVSGCDINKRAPREMTQSHWEC